MLLCPVNPRRELRPQPPTCLSTALESLATQETLLTAQSRDKRGFVFGLCGGHTVTWARS